MIVQGMVTSLPFALFFCTVVLRHLVVDVGGGSQRKTFFPNDLKKKKKYIFTMILVFINLCGIHFSRIGIRFLLFFSVFEKKKPYDNHNLFNNTITYCCLQENTFSILMVLHVTTWIFNV